MTRRHVLIWSGLLIVLLIVVTPRFDRNDLGPLDAITGGGDGPALADANFYVQYVDHLRGDADELPPAPFRYRPLTPVLAAPLPLDALTAINVVNVAALALATAGTWWMLATLGFGDRRRTIGCLLFVVAFPTVSADRAPTSGSRRGASPATTSRAPARG